MKKIIVLFVSLCTLGYNVIAQQSETHKEVTNLSALRFKVILENQKDGVILDLRTADEINSKGFIKGSQQLDFLAKDAEKQIDKLDKTKTYYVYCAGGGRSADAAAYMAEHGFKLIYNLEKGFSEWEQKGFPIEKK